MVYNKFKQGFLRNFLSYILTIVFLIITILFFVFDADISYRVISVVCLGFLLITLVCQLFFVDVFVFKNDCFSTNKYPFNSPKYLPKLLGKVSIRFAAITGIEKRLWSGGSFVLIIHLKEEEPLQYVFAYEDTRDFIYDKLLELTKRQ